MRLGLIPLGAGTWEIESGMSSHSQLRLTCSPAGKEGQRAVNPFDSYVGCPRSWLVSIKLWV